MPLGIIQKQKMYADYLQQLYQCKSRTPHAVPMWAKQMWQPLLQCEHHLFQLSFCYFLFASQLFYSPFHNMVSVLFYLLHGREVPCIHHLLSLSRNIWNSSHLFQYFELTRNIFFYSNSCTFSSRNSSCHVYLVQPNQLPDKPFLFLNLTLDYPLLFHRFPMSLQLWKYRFN